MDYEKNISTKKTKESQSPWLFGKDEDTRRQKDNKKEKNERTKETNSGNTKEVK